jgi:hypothetical protein
MKTPMITKERIDVDMTSEVLDFSLKCGVVLSALIGVWAVSCLVSAINSVGGLNMAKGYITAITGV